MTPDTKTMEKLTATLSTAWYHLSLAAFRHRQLITSSRFPFVSLGGGKFKAL